MKAELIFVGTELLLGEILNTNAQYLSERLALLGVDVFHQQTVGDNHERVAAVLRQALERSDVVITSGGLGPTMDDLTREVAADVCQRPLAPNEVAMADLERFFAARGRVMAENNKRQAMVPQGATLLRNDRGTAPGLIIHADGGKDVVLLPGPPVELMPMFEQQVIPYLTGRIGGKPLMVISRWLKFVDIGESTLEERLSDLIAAQTDPAIAPYAKMARVDLRLSTKAPDLESGLARIAPVEAEITRRLERYIYGRDEESLESAVGKLLQQRGLQLALAESCTGGLIAKQITDVPGSSAYFGFGFTTYSNEAKTRLLGVSPDLLAAHGAVSEEVVRAMAEGALAASGADVALSVSGIAGPDGGTPEKPVGTVWVGLAARGSTSPTGGTGGPSTGGPSTGGLAAGTWALKLQLYGSRADIRERTAVHALALLRRYLLGYLE